MMTNGLAPIRRGLARPCAAARRGLGSKKKSCGGPEGREKRGSQEAGRRLAPSISACAARGGAGWLPRPHTACKQCPSSRAGGSPIAWAGGGRPVQVRGASLAVHGLRQALEPSQRPRAAAGERQRHRLQLRVAPVVAVAAEDCARRRRGADGGADGVVDAAERLGKRGFAGAGRADEAYDAAPAFGSRPVLPLTNCKA